MDGAVEVAVGEGKASVGRSDLFCRGRWRCSRVGEGGSAGGADTSLEEKRPGSLHPPPAKLKKAVPSHLRRQAARQAKARSLSFSAIKFLPAEASPVGSTLGRPAAPAGKKKKSCSISAGAGTEAGPIAPGYHATRFISAKFRHIDIASELV
ncbi:uncharacterized protein PSFLO_03985 [Pseudozyma flocculosa]|uniref:Uncharacterized protein n=1 Tax=Pseudozyma flocculosa TaxID=84751 RepID=A0A5C3F498_9BASI|nr:uncharacterized protein PSFLO_03985 [Pseudozyma flocculosa]